jgi:predicted DNA-binding transcriptional regulator AlpA
MDNSAQTPHRLITLKQVEDLTSLRKSRLYQLIQASEFPQPVKLGRRTAFVQAEVEAWILGQIAARGAKHA